jgi:hypothetical protein
VFSASFSPHGKRIVTASEGRRGCGAPRQAGQSASPDVIRGSGPKQKHALRSRVTQHGFSVTVSINAVITPAVRERTDATSSSHRQTPRRCRKRRRPIGAPLASNAQAVRAILLASATATTLNGLRSRSWVSPSARHRLSGGDGYLPRQADLVTSSAIARSVQQATLHALALSAATSYGTQGRSTGWSQGSSQYGANGSLIEA